MTRFAVARAVNGDRALGALVARDHGADQILMMRKARENHRSDVCENECEGDVSKDLVRFFYGLAAFLTEHPGKRPRLMFTTVNHNAGYHRRSKEEKKENNHRAATRAMPDIAFGANQEHIAQVADSGAGLIHKIREAGVA